MHFEDEDEIAPAESAQENEATNPKLADPIDLKP
jgi:hypothetical protein